MEHHCGSRSWLAASAVSVVAALLTACGGGGGGGGSNNGGGTGNPPPPPGLPYTGVTTAATLGSANTPTLAGGLLWELGFASGNRPVPAQVDSPGLRLPDPGPTIEKTRRWKLARFFKPVTTEACSGGGTVRIDDQTTSSGTGTVIFRFTGCIEEGVRSDGTQRVQINAFDIATSEPTNFNITFEGFTQSAGGSSVDLDGTVRSDVTVTPATTTYDAVARYRPENVQHRLQNLIVRDRVLNASTFETTIQGRFFHSAHGYVDVETIEPLVVSADSGFASAGVLRLRSAAAFADVRFTAANQLTLSLDENGDGTAERAMSAAGLTGLRASNHLPLADAGADATISEGGTATLRGSGTDWEGNALTYEWWCESAPSGGGFVIGPGASTTFEPSAPGTYVIHLRVSDGQPQLSFDAMTLTVLDNIAPVAMAGNDVETVERATVVLDASASTDAENDELQYTWTLLQQPAPGAAPATGVGQTFSFEPSHPGNYRYRLTVADEFGSSQDEISIFAGHLIGFGFSSAIILDPTTTPELITRTAQVNTNFLYSGPPVPLTVSTDVPWLDVVSAPSQTGPGAIFVLTVDVDELESMENGDHVARITVSPAGYTARSQDLLLMLSLPKIEHIAPYVSYTGHANDVIMYGSHLHQTLGATLVIGGVEVQGFSEAMLDRTNITLPALPVGEYDMHVKNNLGLVLPMGRYVVRDPPTYPDGEFALPGRIEALEYDMERDVFFGVSWDQGSSFEAWRLHFDGDGWQRENIVVPAPQSLALNVDGTRLFVTTASCGVREVDPGTLEVLDAAVKSTCSIEWFGMAAGLADGRMLIGDTNQWPTVYEYPSFAVSTSQFPLIHTPNYALSRNRQRLLWAESPTISAPRTFHFYDLPSNTFSQIVPNDPDTYFLTWNLAISADGHRIMHRQDVYEDGQYIGSIDGPTNALLSPALTTAGDRAVVLDPDTDVLALFDLTDGPDFPKIDDIATLPDNVGGGTRVAILPDDTVAFVFTTTFGPSDVSGFKLYVRNLP